MYIESFNALIDVAVEYIRQKGANMEEKYKIRKKEVFDKNTNMRALIICLIKKAKEHYDHEHYLSVVEQVCDATIDVVNFSYQAENAFLGDEEARLSFDGFATKAEKAIVVINENAKRLEMNPIIPEYDGTLAGLFQVCSEYKYDACDYIIHCGLACEHQFSL